MSEENDELLPSPRVEERAGPPPPLPPGLQEDDKYLLLLTTAIRKCLEYKPKFGHGGKSGVSLKEFTVLYGADPFYHWFGVDSPLMYAAHKAAGGMTSVYRQIGIGSQWVFYQMLQDHLGLSAEQALWSYTVPSAKGKDRTLSLDGRIEVADIRDQPARERVSRWLAEVHEVVGVPVRTRPTVKGVVFEVRQGYKSKDSKRQNADIANASKAYADLYVPVIVLFSTQIDDDVAARYRESLWLLLTGTTTGKATNSTYAFCRDVVGFDLAGFFQRNSAKLKGEVEAVLKKLLSASE